MEEVHIHKRLLVTAAAVDVIAGNNDLLSEILRRLPARSLIRFSLVCKHWSSLILIRKQFRLGHFYTPASSSALPASGIYFYNCLTNLPKIESLPLADNVTSLPPLPLLDLMATIEVMQVKAQVTVTQSCNGLLMCEISCKSDVSHLKFGLVYNPVTKACHKLPSPYDDKCYGAVHYNLISDSSEAPYYKALCLKRLGCYYFGDIDVSVYVPGSDDSWRSCCRFSPPSGMCFDGGVFWNGAIHWIGEYRFIYFDANSKEIVRKHMPPRPQGHCNQKIRYFGEWGGHLHLIQVQSLNAKKFNVLELDKDTWKWSVKYRVHLAKLISAFPEMVQQGPYGPEYAFSILSVIRGENEEDSALLLTIPGKVVAYNLVCKTVKVIRELPGELDDKLRFKPVNAFQYTESLAPVEKWTVGSK